MDELRIVQSFKNGKWINIVFEDIKKGDIYRMFEPTGEPVIYEGKQTLYALSDMYLHEKLKKVVVDTDAYKEEIL